MEQRSLWYWCKHEDAVHHHVTYELEWHELPCRATSGKFATFTVAELGEMLPKHAVSSWRYFPDEFKDDAPEGWRWKCFYDDGDENILRVWADTEADARARTLIYPVNNKIIAPLAC